jgi:MATE family multidrug resistance protein
MMLSAIALTLFPYPLARAYTDDATVIAFATTLIPLAGFFQVFDGTQVVSIGVLRGAGDTRTPMVVNLLGYWLVGLPVSLWLGFRTSLGAPGLWWGFVIGLAIVAIVLVLRVRQKLWGPLERLQVDLPPPAVIEPEGSGTRTA